MINDVCNILGTSYFTCRYILTEHLNLRQIAAVFAPFVSNADHQQHQASI